MYEEEDFIIQETHKKTNTTALSKKWVYMSNTLARKQTRWSRLEQQLFLSAVACIPKIDDDDYVTIKKVELCRLLNVRPDDLRKLFQQVRRKSEILFTINEDEWEDGYLISYVKSTRHEIKVQFTKAYLPLLKDFSNGLFTKYKLENIAKFKSKYSILLYQYLVSWYNPKYIWSSRTIYNKDLIYLFGLSDTDYVRKNGKFSRSDFEKYTLNVAIKEINEFGAMNIKMEKVYSGRFVDGYSFKYCHLDKDGFPLDLSENNNKDKLELASGQLNLFDD